MKLKKIINEKFETICAILVFVFLVSLLCVQSVGIADNGDFNRVLSANFMDYIPTQNCDDLYFNYVNTSYKILVNLSIVSLSYINTHAFLVFVSKTLNQIFYSRQIYDFRFLTLIYILLFCVSIYNIMKSLKTDSFLENFLVFSSLIFIFLDKGNFLYFGSLYAEGCAFAFFMLFISFFLKIFKENRDFHILPLFLCLFMFLGSKMQYTFLSLLFTYFVHCTTKFLKRAKKFKVWVLFAIIVSTNSTIYFVQPKYLNEITTYDSVFYGIVKNKENTKLYLEELGISSEYEVLAATHGFQQQYPIDIHSQQFRRDFYEKIHKTDIVWFYLKHPKLLINALNYTAQMSFKNSPEYLGNRTKNFSEQKVSYNYFNFYTKLKEKFFPKNLIFIFSFLILYFLTILYKSIVCNDAKLKFFYSLLVTLIIFSAVQFVLPYIGNGGADVAKQLYMFNVIFDSLLFNLIVLLIRKIFFVLRAHLTFFNNVDE